MQSQSFDQCWVNLVRNQSVNFGLPRKQRIGMKKKAQNVKFKANADNFGCEFSGGLETLEKQCRNIRRKN